MPSKQNKTFEIRMILPKQAGGSIEICEQHFGVPWMAKIKFENGAGYGELLCLEAVSDSRGGEKKWKLLAGMEAYLTVGGHESLKGAKSSFLFEPYKTSTQLFMVEQEDLDEEDAVVKIRVTIKAMAGTLAASIEDFSSEQGRWTDVALKVGEKTFCVNRAVLARASNTFREQLYDDTDQPTATELVINDVDPIVFETFLQLVHLKKPYIKIDHIEKILELAQQYGVQRARDGCEQFLIGLEGIEMPEAVQLADKYGFKEFLKSLLRSLWRIEQYEILKGVLCSLKAETQAVIAQKMLEDEKQEKLGEIKIRGIRGQEFSILSDGGEKVQRTIQDVARIERNAPEKQRLQIDQRDLVMTDFISDYVHDGSSVIQSIVAD